MEYLHLFETQVSHDSLYEGDNYKEPWIAYTLDNASVTFNKPHDYSKDYLTIEALEDGNITIMIPKVIDSTYVTSISYSKNKLNWTETIIDNTEQTISIPVSSGENVYLKGIALQLYNDSDYGIHINSTANINASGNIMSLLYGDDFKDKTSLPEGSQYTFNELFKDNTHLINAENLILLVTELTEYCYSHMFDGCTTLTTAPELPATILKTECYSYMFYRCTSLTTAPSLPAITLAPSCYYSMFENCTSLNVASELPATTLATFCYQYMFKGCTSLTTAPALPATTLATFCYQYMFSDCTALTAVTELPATMLANYCYQYMFKGCTSLTTAPELPATTLAPYCYNAMFSGCTSLITAPSLPATTLATNCYYGMFRGCTSLNESSELPASTLTTECYREMFYGCNNLIKITMLATNVSALNCLNSWVSGVASTGTFIKAPAMTSLTTGTSGIPTGWTVIDDTEYLTLTALGNGTITITIPSYIDSTYATSLSYSKNKLNWTETIIDDTEQTISIPVSSGENVYLKGIANQLGNSSAGVNINSTANINASGNIMSLLYGDDFKDKTLLSEESQYTFNELFKDNTHLISAENLILHAIMLTDRCYNNMFKGCSALTTAPELPATTLATNCYYGMFLGCTSLTTAPSLPATELADNCYYYMFRGCTALTTAPELPATTLAPSCYYYMFYGCTALTTSPKLPATTLATNCYYGMFRGCTALTTSPKLPATILAPSCYYYMFRDCTSLNESSELPAATLATNCYYGMFRGCTSLNESSELPAATLTTECYREMFYGCSKLNNITMLATDISATNCLTNWVNGVASTGTFIKAPSMTSLPSGVSGIPSGWNVVDDTEYLTLSALDNGTITITIPSCIDSTYATYISYSKNKLNWTETIIDDTEQTISIPVSSGENVYLKGIAKAWYNFDYEYGININSTANINASGNIMSLLYGDNFKDKMSLPEEREFIFCELFIDNIYLINAKDLVLPATTLTNSCYSGMFSGCTSLITAPALQATILASSCYDSMFQGCTSLTTAPALQATILASSCYGHMFYGCTSLTTAPELPATTLADWCYLYMFSDCTSLTTAPELPVTTLTPYCYREMFNGCTSLTTAPALPAMTLANDCYYEMFRGCTALTVAPELPATTLAKECYYGMFYDCYSLTTAPALPATTLKDYCYDRMFYECTSLTTAPELPAPALINSCYYQMFYNCSKLNSIAMFATDISASNCLTNWVSGVASTGTFIKAPSMTSLTTGVNGIPEGWTVMNDTEYLTLSALDNGNITITIPAEVNSSIATSLSYSKDKSNWTDTIINNTEQTISIPVSSGENVYLKGIANRLGNGSTCVNIDSTANINASGNVMSLLYGDNYKNKISFPNGSKYTFRNLFRNNTHLINAENLILPATTLAEGCYIAMFQGCTLLTIAPELPATTLSKTCYFYMFYGCTALTTSPKLPATTLAPSCYYYMFYGCTALTTSPKLPATTLATNCYYGMFRGCTALTTSPKLPATTLAPSCYYYMFRDCTSLNESSELPAATLATNCYREMFYGCSKLNNITMLATDISATNCLTNWVNGVASTGVFVKAPAMTSLTTGTSGIPSGWNVVDDTEYLTLSALDNGNITITIPNVITSEQATSLSYSKDKLNWTETIIDNTEQTIPITVTGGENIYLKGIAKQLGNDSRTGVNINSTTNINVSGNVMSLLYGDNYKNKIAFPNGSQYTLGHLFKNNTHLINAENLILPATTLAEGCYIAMFFHCTSLTTAPELPATTLATNCYFQMFNGCSNLIKITMLATDISAKNCLNSWVKNVASTGTFTKASSASLPKGTSGIPSGWKIVNK